MTTFLYGLVLQFKLDKRSKSLLVTYYVVPLIFFLLMGGIFTSIMPNMKETLVQSMIVMGVSMGAFLGYPHALAQTYGSDIKKVYQANGVSLSFGLITMFLSAFIHLMLMCSVIVFLAPVLFEAQRPERLPLFYAALAIYLSASLSVGSALGLIVMLSGIMFPAELLPNILNTIGQIFPAHWGYRFMQVGGFQIQNLWYLLVILILASIICGLLVKKQKFE
jgi:ABC-2 type transport system permease protein